MITFTFKKLNVKLLTTKFLLLNNKFTQLDIKSKMLLDIIQKHSGGDGKGNSFLALCKHPRCYIKAKLILLRVLAKSC